MFVDFLFSSSQFSTIYEPRIFLVCSLNLFYSNYKQSALHCYALLVHKIQMHNIYRRITMTNKFIQWLKTIMWIREDCWKEEKKIGVHIPACSIFKQNEIIKKRRRAAANPVKNPTIATFIIIFHISFCLCSIF